MQTSSLSCFKAYDIRGKVPDDLDADIAYRIGRACAQFLMPERVVVGRDVRISSRDLCDALCRGLTDSGTDVFDIGVCGTEMVYFAVFSQDMDGGIMVTASHNPMDYNGMKLVRRQSMPISSDTGLNAIREIVQSGNFSNNPKKGELASLDIDGSYVSHLLKYVSHEKLEPFKVVVDAGNGSAGRIIDLLEKHLPFAFIKVNHEPDGRFPNGVPNPLLPENRGATADAVRLHKADIGIAWDGDFDRCFFFDEEGNFIEGYYIVGLLASSMLGKCPGGKIIHDPRLTWNTIDIITEKNGVPIMSKTGHAFIKERMRAEDAIYGGEMSGHHYFKDFAFCDSGMIPWLMVLEIMSLSGKRLSDLVSERMKLFPASGEINRRLKDPKAVLCKIEDVYKADAVSIDYTDGLSIGFPKWRFNLRLSNTEPVARLNVESRGDAGLMREKTEELLALTGKLNES